MIIKWYNISKLLFRLNTIQAKAKWTVSKWALSERQVEGKWKASELSLVNAVQCQTLETVQREVLQNLPPFRWTEALCATQIEWCKRCLRGKKVLSGFRLKLLAQWVSSWVKLVYVKRTFRWRSVSRPLETFRCLSVSCPLETFLLDACRLDAYPLEVYSLKASPFRGPSVGRCQAP